MKKLVIIGSGLGGLSTGIILSKLGYQVIIVEKNKDAGGLLRSYRRSGVDLEVGVHYLGSLAKGQVLDRFFDYLGVKESIPVSRMGENGVIDRYIFNASKRDALTFDLPEGIDRFSARLHTFFPNDTRCIEKVIHHIRMAADSLHNLDLLLASDDAFTLFEQTDPYGTILDGLGCSSGLRSVLGMASSWLGVPLADCPAYYHNMALASYLSSSWRLEKSGAHMADVFVKQFESLGGVVRTESEVSELLVKDRVVQGVKFAGGEEEEADIVIAAIHPQKMLSMLPAGATKPSYANRIRRLQNSHSALSVHALVDSAVLPEIPYNLFDVDTDKKGDITDLRYYQIRKSRREGRNVLSILTSGHDTLWQPWKKTKSGERPEQYIQLKTELAKKLIEEAQTVIGKTKGLQLLDVATPLTMRDWVGSPEGSAYGVLRCASQLLATGMLNRTAVKNLYLSGQNVLAPGVIGVIMGSFSTVKLLLGQQEFRERVRL